MRVVRLLAACMAAATCACDRPVVPNPPADPPTAETPATALSAADRAALAAAITDAQAWLLPSVADRDATTHAIAGRFTDLATSLARSDTSVLVPVVAEARQELEADTVGEPGEHFIERAALGLVLDDVEAVIQGRLRLVPFDAAASAATRSASDPKSPTSNRSHP